jgi:hypothetical protein
VAQLEWKCVIPDLPGDEFHLSKAVINVYSPLPRFLFPGHAVVLSIDEKSQIQALDRTHPGLPIKPGRCQTMTE